MYGMVKLERITKIHRFVLCVFVVFCGDLWQYLPAIGQSHFVLCKFHFYIYPTNSVTLLRLHPEASMTTQPLHRVRRTFVKQALIPFPQALTMALPP